MFKGFLCLLWLILCLQPIFGQKKSEAIATNIDVTSKRRLSSSDLPIRRVVIYSNGVAHIERRGFVSGDAEINLSFTQSQIDDVLKSMIVVDLGKGKIGDVNYESSVPAEARLAEIPFGVATTNDDEENSPRGLFGVLSQLQGANVLVSSARGAATGAVLTVERKQAEDVSDENKSALPFSAFELVIGDASGELTRFDSKDIRSVRILDENAKRDVNAFSSVASAARRRDSKTIVINASGEGSREILVNYTIAAPIWKMTYRVVLDVEGKPFFQGWAIVDNVSDEDWKNVELSLISGTPISFIQNLNKPLFRYRPVVPIPEDLNLSPQVYDPEIGVGEGGGFGSGSGSATGSGSGSGTVDESLEMQETIKTTTSDLLRSEASGVETAAKGSDIGDFFEYKITEPVNLSKNRSAMIPILQMKMEGERISIYDESIKMDRPMNGLLLTNTSNLTFESGSMTILDRDILAGESLIERLKPNEQRFISYAVDLGTLVNTNRKENREPTLIVRAVQGVLQLHYFESRKTIYTLVNQTNRNKVVVVQHPIEKNWSLAPDSEKPATNTQNAYRFRVALAPNETSPLTVIERHGLMDSIQISKLSERDIELLVAGRKISDTLREALTRIVDLREKIAEIDAAISALQKEQIDISNDQSRIRENIKSLATTRGSAQLIARYVTKANQQESRIEELNAELKSYENRKRTFLTEIEGEIKKLEEANK